MLHLVADGDILTFLEKLHEENEAKKKQRNKKVITTRCKLEEHEKGHFISPICPECNNVDPRGLIEEAKETSISVEAVYASSGYLMRCKPCGMEFNFQKEANIFAQDGILTLNAIGVSKDYIDRISAASNFEK